MATYSPSKITKDGNTYNFTDATKIPLSGTNALAGSIVPSTDNSVDIGSSTKNIKAVYSKNIIVSGSGNGLSLNNSSESMHISVSSGASIDLCGKDYTHGNNQGKFILTAFDGNTYAPLAGTPSGTLTWGGQPIQYVSDQRLKQQIAEIDDKLLDAWEDVKLSQFKYNDAVDQKKDKARLHTGYVVQQIDKACKEHGVDISEYGLYCHEEYPQETEEVEVEQADGTKTKERKVIREASEHYSLRYTEALIVECAYLRKCIKELRAEIEQLKSSK